MSWYLALFGIFAVLISLFFLYRNYRYYRVPHFIGISAGIAIFIPFSFLFIMREILLAVEYQLFLRFSIPAMMILTTMGIAITYNSVRSLMQVPLAYRHVLLGAMLSWSMGAFLLVYKIEWTPEGWVSGSSQPWPIVFFVTMVIWLLFELALLFRKVDHSRSEYSVLGYLGILFFISGLLVGLYEHFSTPINLFLLLVDIGAMCFGLLIYFNPYIFYPSDLELQNLIIEEKSGSLADPKLLMSFSDEFDDEDTIKTQLLPTVVSLLSETLKQVQPPKQIEYLDKTLMLEETANHIGVLIVNKPVTPLRSSLRKIMETMEERDMEMNEIISLFEFAL